MFYRRQQGEGRGDGAPPDPVAEPVEGREPVQPYRPAVRPPVTGNRNLVKVLVGAIFLAGTAALVFGERGLMDVRRSKQELREIQRKVKQKEETVKRLAAEVARLETDPEALERVAREQLNLARPGEIIILLPRDPNWGKPPEAVP